MILSLAQASSSASAKMHTSHLSQTQKVPAAGRASVSRLDALIMARIKQQYDALVALSRCSQVSLLA
jgi:hypothetical protein